MAALTGIERANFQFSSVQLGLSECTYVQLVRHEPPETALDARRCHSVVTRHMDNDGPPVRGLAAPKNPGRPDCQCRPKCKAPSSSEKPAPVGFWCCGPIPPPGAARRPGRYLRPILSHRSGRQTLGACATRQSGIRKHRAEPGADPSTAQARAILARYLEFDPASAAVRKQLRAITRSGLPLP
jgi:hypothetical protein